MLCIFHWLSFSQSDSLLVILAPGTKWNALPTNNISDFSGFEHWNILDVVNTKLNEIFKQSSHNFLEF